MFIKWVGISRGHSQKLLKKRVRLDVEKYCFSDKVCDEWNRLPGEKVNAGSVDSLRVNWISTTGASEDLKEFLRHFLPCY